MAVAVTSANTNANQSPRVAVRTSSGIPYVVVWNQTANDIEVYKGNSSTPTSFTEQDTSNNPSSGSYGLPAARIDSTGVIHIVYSELDGKTSACRYVTFSTSTDTFSGDVDLDADIGETPGSLGAMHCAIAIDSNDIPHVVYTRYENAMGTDYYTCSYNNRIGGSWNGSSVEVDGVTNTLQARSFDLCVNSSDVPVISYQDTTNNDLKRAVGNANDATSFTLTTLDNFMKSGVRPTSVCIDSEGTIYVAAIDSTNFLILFDGTTARTTTKTTIFVSIAAVGSDIHVFYSNNPGNVLHDVWNGTSWDGATTLHSGSFSWVNCKFSLNNNFGSGGTDYGNLATQTEVDYCYKDSGDDVQWDTLSLSSGITLTVQDSSHSHSADNTVLTHAYTATAQESSHAHAADNVGLNVHLISDESLHGHTADNTILTHAYNAVADESLHAHSADQPTVTHDYNLITQESSHGHVSDNVDLDVSVTLEMQDSSHGHTADQPTLTHHYNLVSDETLHSHDSENAVLSSHYDLVSDESLHSHLSDQPTLSHDYNLATQESLHGHTADQPTLTHHYDLVSDESLHSHQSDDVGLNIYLVSDESLHGHTADNTILTHHYDLVSGETIHAHTADNVDLEGGIILEVAESSHAHLADAPTLTHHYDLISNESSHSHTAENIGLNIHLISDESIHGHVADNTILTHEYNLVSDEALHGHTSDNTILTSHYDLLSDESLHGHQSDNIDLDPSTTLIVADSNHSHTADQPTLTHHYDLIGDESLHSHAADNIDLEAGVTLIVAESNHAHSVEQPTLSHHYDLISDETLHSHSADNTLLEIGLEVFDTLHAHVTDNADLVQASTLSVDDTLHDHLADNIDLGLPILEVQSSTHAHSVDIVFLDNHFEDTLVSNNIAVVYRDSLGYLRVHEWLSAPRLRYYNIPAWVKIQYGAILEVSSKLDFVNLLKNQETPGAPIPLTMSPTTQTSEPINRPRELKTKKLINPFSNLSAYKRRKIKKMYNAGDHDSMLLYMDKNGLTGGCSTCNKKTKAIRLVEHGIRSKLL